MATDDENLNWLHNDDAPTKDDLEGPHGPPDPEEVRQAMEEDEEGSRS